jgi:hypothetical protein
MDPTHTWGLSAGDEIRRSQWLAAAIPGWNEAEHSSGPANGSFVLPLYASRVLSDSGRLFFDSADSLVPQDVNKSVDVYEYEPPPRGAAEAPENDTCTSESATYSSRSGGCVSMISSGQGGGASEFVDASASGDDVFFTTIDKLVKADTDSVSDMYDASVCGTGESVGETKTHACLPKPGVATPPCESTDSCRVTAPAQPGVFGAPPSATFSGAGNATPAVAAPVAKKSLTRAQKLANALKVCRKDKKKSKRTSCEKSARKRYGPVKAKKAGTKRRAAR